MKDPTNAPRWVKAYWADSVKDSYKAGLEIIALNRNELLQDVLAALADIRVPIYALNARQVENNCAVVSLTIGDFTETSIFNYQTSASTIPSTSTAWWRGFPR